MADIPMTTPEQVNEVCLALPGVTRSTKREAWDLDGRMLAWLRTFSKADLRRFGDERVPGDPILAVRTGDLGHKQELLAADADLVFTIPHLDGYSAVLVELGRADPDRVTALIRECWQARAPRSARAEDRITMKEKRMVAVGDHVSWNTEQGRTRGTVTAKKVKAFQLAGHRFTASDDEPMFVVTSEKTGAKAAHKPSALRVLKR